MFSPGKLFPDKSFQSELLKNLILRVSKRFSSLLTLWMESVRMLAEIKKKELSVVNQAILFVELLALRFHRAKEEISLLNKL